ncbi:hotdog family protein [Erwinia sp. 9145]|uniref:ApeP family dehydratase n=1 Tax=Erwinia sp. 9145 TaxID=1500895 RepID=UPI0005595C50|nr:hotdog family protein [Erwinia sp. 9145]
MAEFDEAVDYLPHETPMVLLERVLAVSDEGATCQVVVSPDGVLAPFLDVDGALPAWFGVEMIAQAIGVWSGWHHRQHTDGKPVLGMLLGARAFRCDRAAFPAGATLTVSVHLLMRDEKIGSFEGEIDAEGQHLASGRLNTWQPDENELQQLLQQGKKG